MCYQVTHLSILTNWSWNFIKLLVCSHWSPQMINTVHGHSLARADMAKVPSKLSAARVIYFVSGKILAWTYQNGQKWAKKWQKRLKNGQKGEKTGNPAWVNVWTFFRCVYGEQKCVCNLGHCNTLSYLYNIKYLGSIKDKCMYIYLYLELAFKQSIIWIWGKIFFFSKGANIYSQSFQRICVCLLKTWWVLVRLYKSNRIFL